MAENPEIVLQGDLLKKSKSWLDPYIPRHFCLYSDNLLHYYSKTSGKLKGVFDVSNAEVSDLFVSKHRQELIYCVKVVIPSVFEDDDLHEGGGNLDYLVDDNSSNDGGDVFLDPDDGTNYNNSNNNNNNAITSAPSLLETVGLPHLGSMTTALSAATGTDANNTSSNNNNINIPDPLSLLTSTTTTEPSTPQLRQRFRSSTPQPDDNNNHNHGSHTPTASNTMTDNTTTTNADHLSPVKRSLTNASSATPANNNNNNSNSPEELIRHYRQRRKWKKEKDKKKLVQGTKVAVAAGATATLAVATAGVGLVAGLVFVGAAAAGGGTASLGLASDGKKELVLASYKYEITQAWRQCLIASRETRGVEQSTWGQMFAMDGKRKARNALLPAASSEPPSLSLSAAQHHPVTPTTAKSSSSFTMNDHHHQSYYVFRRQPGQWFIDNNQRQPYTTSWQPLVGGWTSLLLPGGALRIFRQEGQPRHGLLETALQLVWHRDEDDDDNAKYGGKKHRNNNNKNSPIHYHLPCPPVKSHTVLSTSAVDAFMCLMSLGCVAQFDYNRLEEQSQTVSFRIVEAIDDNTDIIHLMLRPLYLFPTMTSARDFCLYRYWRLEPDGSYVVSYDSVEHSYCLPYHNTNGNDGQPTIVRGEMHKVITIAPHKRSKSRVPNSTSSKNHHHQNTAKSTQECIMTAVVQMDPRGWIPTASLPVLSNQSYAEAFGIAILGQLLDIRDAIDMDRFEPMWLEQAELPTGCLSDTVETNAAATTTSALPEHHDPRIPSYRSGSAHGIAQVRNADSDDSDEEAANDHYDFSLASRELDDTATLARVPRPLNAEHWCEPDSNNFKVRGKNYKSDGIKVHAGDSVARLVAVDIVSVSEPLYSGFSEHPKERIQRALAKEKELLAQGRASDMPPFVFVINIVIPGPPFYHGVFYYAIDDISKINGKDGTPSSKLCQQFFFGDSDDFRDGTFKLIPQIVQGNFMVRKAVGSTPAIMGKKLRQLYVRSDRYCEVVLDCASSSVATGVIRLALGYAKTLVVDMAFLLEGNTEDTLPERVFGCVRLTHPDFGPHMRHVVDPNE